MQGIFLSGKLVNKQLEEGRMRLLLLQACMNEQVVEVMAVKLLKWKVCIKDRKLIPAWSKILNAFSSHIC